MRIRSHEFKDGTGFACSLAKDKAGNALFYCFGGSRRDAELRLAEIIRSDKGANLPIFVEEDKPSYGGDGFKPIEEIEYIPRKKT